jgi:hypothetical protein
MFDKAEQEFYEDLKSKILQSITDGANNLVFWGFTPTCVFLLSDLKQLGLLNNCVQGVIDSNPTKHNSKIFDYTVLNPTEIATLELDTLVITSDVDKESILMEFSVIDKRMPLILVSGSKNYQFQDPIFESILSSCPLPSKALGYPNMLIHIYQSLSYLARNNIKGNVAEFGAFQCGTTIIIAKALKELNSNCKVYAFDTFDGFPAKKSALDMYNGKKCEFHDFETVHHYCSQYSNIELIKGDIYDTYLKIKGIPLMFSFFDTDNYSVTKKALELCYEQTVSGGILAFDHYCSDQLPKTLGERIAIKEVLSDKNVFNLYGTGIFIKVSSPCLRE